MPDRTTVKHAKSKYKPIAMATGFILIIIALLIVFMPFLSNSPSASSDNNGDESSLEAQTSHEPLLKYEIDLPELKTTIYPQRVLKSNYLFLPSFADYNDLSSLKFASGSTVCKKDNNAITMRESNGNVELTRMFGEMLPGEEYEITVNLGDRSEDYKIMKSSDISSAYLQIHDADLIDLHAYKDCVSKDAEMAVVPADGTNVKTANIVNMHGRGNSSWGGASEKRSYALKFDEEISLADGASPAKKWNLIANNCTVDFYTDRTGLANAAAYWIYNASEGESGIKYDFTDLYIDGKYRGTYMFTEKVEVDPARIDMEPALMAYEDEESTHTIIQETGIGSDTDNNMPLYWETAMMTVQNVENAGAEDPAIAAGIQAYQYSENSEKFSDGGYLLEVDARFGDSSAWFITRRGVAVALKDPEYPTKEQVQQIAVYVQQCEDTLFSDTKYNGDEHYSEYLDVPSFAKMFLLDAFTGQPDAMWSSAFMYVGVDSRGEIAGPMKAGPAWDYDIWNSCDTLISDVGRSLVSGEEIEMDLNGKRWYQRLAEDDYFKKIATQEYRDRVESAIASCKTYLQYEIARLSNSQKMNCSLWLGDFGDETQGDAAAFMGMYNARQEILANNMDAFSEGIILDSATDTAGMSVFLIQ